MLNEILLAIIQAITEFLPISSSGHLALVSNLISEPNLFFITALHIASLIAVLIFTRKEIYNLITFNKKYRKLWIYLIIATVPAALFGFFFKNIIEKTFSSFLFLGMFFTFNGFLLLFTKHIKNYNKKLNTTNTFIIGLFQSLGLFPGISRSGATISTALYQGIDRETAVKFSFLLFIPLSIGALILESGEFFVSYSLIISFIICFILSLVFLNLLLHIVKREKFWIFSIYSFIIGLICLILYVL